MYLNFSSFLLIFLKLPILFEELGEKYDWALIDFEKNQQKRIEFKKINPNGRIPALIYRQ
jgi:glutathione S-transferase